MKEDIPQLRGQNSALENSVAQDEGVGQDVFHSDMANARSKVGIQEVEKDYGISVISIVKLSNITSYLRAKKGMDKELASIERYQQEYGIQ